MITTIINIQQAAAKAAFFYFNGWSLLSFAKKLIPLQYNFGG
jgi:hypothetical protein